MKFLLYSDNHWSQYSSIIRKRGEKYSARLENQIVSLNWALRLAETQGCDMTICLGDFFDQPILNSEEITALKEIKWPNIPNLFIAGNHEMGMQNHLYTSSSLFNLLPSTKVFLEPTTLQLDNDLELCILPYILERNRKSLSEYFSKNFKRRIILSHNDISGIRYGKFKSLAGFSIEEIQDCCNLFINGHLHNGERVSDKIFNIGNLTGQNFTEDAFKYEHDVFILNTDPINIEVYENPYAFNFYKIDSVEEEALPFDTEIRGNAIISAKVLESQVNVFDDLYKSCNIVEKRLVIIPDKKDILDIDNKKQSLSLDHINKFREFILENLQVSTILEEELQEVCS